jgi:hypothetical protein
MKSRELWGNVKKTNTDAIGVQEREQTEKEIGKIFKEKFPFR